MKALGDIHVEVASRRLGVGLESSKERGLGQRCLGILTTNEYRGSQNSSWGEVCKVLGASPIPEDTDIEVSRVTFRWVIRHVPKLCLRNALGREGSVLKHICVKLRPISQIPRLVAVAKN